MWKAFGLRGGAVARIQENEETAIKADRNSPPVEGRGTSVLLDSWQPDPCLGQVPAVALRGSKSVISTEGRNLVFPQSYYKQDFSLVHLGKGPETFPRSA